MQDAVLNLCRVKIRDQQRLGRGPLTEYSQFGEGIPFLDAVPRSANDSGGAQPGRVLKCKGWETDPNAYLYFILQTKVWDRVCKLIGREDWISDSDYAKPSSKDGICEPDHTRATVPGLSIPLYMIRAGVAMPSTTAENLSTTENILVTLACGLVVALYASRRYNTPETNRFSTTRALFLFTGAGYVAASLTLFFLLSEIVLKPGVLTFLGLEDAQKYLTKFSAPPVIAAVLLTTLLPNVGVVSTADAWLLQRFQAWGRIPLGVRILADSSPSLPLLFATPTSPNCVSGY